MENEIWKDIIGYEGIYQVSNRGRVKRLAFDYVDSIGRVSHSSEYIRKRRQLKGGYGVVMLCKGSKRKMFRIARLVAMAFIPNPEHLPQVNHKDENPMNDCVENLEWCTSKYNNNYGGHGKRISQAAKERYKDPEFIEKMHVVYRQIRNNPSWKAKQRESQLNNSSSKAVVMMDLEGNDIKTFSSMMEASRQTGCYPNNISLCCNGIRLKKTGGYKWRFADEK